MINVYKAVPEQSSAHFNLKNTLIPDVEGDFSCLSGSFTYDPENLDQSKIEAFIDVKTIDTGDSEKNAHLKSDKFFNAEKFPTITFISQSIKDVGDNQLEVSGFLTVKDITKNVVLKVERPAPEDENQNEMGLSANTLINRNKFKLNLGSLLEVAEVLVGDDIHIDMDIQLIKE